MITPRTENPATPWTGNSQQGTYNLAQTIIEEHAIPAEYPEDALHIAVAATNGIDLIITWNFAHINNPFKRMIIRQVVENAGYICPEICSPEELMEARE